MDLNDLQLLGCVLLLAYVARRVFIALPMNIMTARRGWYAALVVVAFSLGVTLMLGYYAENRPWSEVTNFGAMPWSLTYGCGIILPLAVLVAAASAPAWHDSPLALSPWWRWACGLAGLVLGSGFHQWSRGRYASAGHADLVSSITKWWCDFAIVSVLLGVLLFVAVPLFQYAETGYRWAFGVLVVIQLSLMAIDTNRGLDLGQLHAACNMACGSQNIGGHLHDLLGMFFPQK